MVSQALESFEAQDKQNIISQRMRQSVRRGMVRVLNTGFAEGKELFYPQHQKKIVLPKPGDTIEVPKEVAEWMVRMFRKQLQYVHAGEMPANFTPPPGYRLVPVEVTDAIPAPDEDTLLVEPEEEDKE